jgi:hypothetical protein
LDGAQRTLLPRSTCYLGIRYLLISNLLTWQHLVQSRGHFLFGGDQKTFEFAFKRALPGGGTQGKVSMFLIPLPP